MRGQMLSPDLIFMDVTPYCNLKCKHCYSKSQLTHLKEMELSEIKELIDVFSKIKVFNLDIVGREPFMRKDILEIIEYARNKNLIINLATNATLITNTVAKKLKQLNVNQIQVSIDHSNPEIHNDFRQSDCFDKVITGIKHLVKNKIDVVVCTTLTNFNYDDILNIIKLIHPLGVKYYRLKILICDEKSKKYQVNKMQYKKTVETLFFAKNKFPGLIIRQLHHSFLLKKEVPYLPKKALVIPCDACISRISLTFDKKITPCIALSEKYSEEFVDFKNAWLNSKVVKSWKHIFKNIKGKCSYCGYRYFCGGGCRAAVYGITGDITSSDPLCWYNPKKEGDKK